MTRKPKHKWEFAARLRARAFGWNGTALACARMKEAIKEIKTVGKADPVLAGEGAVILLEKLSAAMEQIDSSSGTLGSATYSAIEELVGVIVLAPAPEALRAAWLERLWEAFEADDYGYLDTLADHWGDLCLYPDLANRWADDLLPCLMHTWGPDRLSGSYFHGTSAALSAMLAAFRFQEILDTLKLAPYVSWNYRKFGVRALAQMGQIDQALDYAQASCGLNDSQYGMSSMCEKMLIDAGRWQEAYSRFAVNATRAGTNLATFRAIAKKYPAIPAEQILADLVEASGTPGKWFATAKELKRFDYALRLVNTSPADPLTLNRAARDFEIKNPPFALGAAIASVKWIVAGHGYDLTTRDFVEPYSTALRIASALGNTEEVKGELNAIVKDNPTWAAIASKI